MLQMPTRLITGRQERRREREEENGGLGGAEFLLLVGSCREESTGIPSLHAAASERLSGPGAVVKGGG